MTQNRLFSLSIRQSILGPSPYSLFYKAAVFVDRFERIWDHYLIALHLCKSNLRDLSLKLTKPVNNDGQLSPLSILYSKRAEEREKREPDLHPEIGFLWRHCIVAFPSSFHVTDNAESQLR